MFMEYVQFMIDIAWDFSHIAWDFGGFTVDLFGVVSFGIVLGLGYKLIFGGGGDNASK